jgi:hypothetical protein
MKTIFGRTTILALWLLSGLFLVVNPGLAAGRPGNADALKLPGVSVTQAEIPRIMAVLEGKVEDRELLETARKKLVTLDRRKTRLLSSLCDRVANEGQSAGRLHRCSSDADSIPHAVQESAFGT